MGLVTHQLHRVGDNFDHGRRLFAAQLTQMQVAAEAGAQHGQRFGKDLRGLVWAFDLLDRKPPPKARGERAQAVRIVEHGEKRKRFTLSRLSRQQTELAADARGFPARQQKRRVGV